MDLNFYFKILKIKYKSIFSLSILLALPFIFFSPFVKTIDNVDYFTLKNNKEIKFYNDFKKIFNDDEFFVIAIKNKELFTYKNLTFLKNLTNELEEKLQVKEVKSLANVNDSIGKNDEFYVGKFLETIPDDKKGLKALKKNALNNNLYSNVFISKKVDIYAIVLKIDEENKNEKYRKEILFKTRQILKNNGLHKNQFHIAGWTATNLALSKFMKKDIMVFIPVTYILITLAIYFFFRNIWITAASLLNVSICLGSVMGLFVIFDINLNNVTSIISPLIMALSLCDTIHIFSHMEESIFAGSDPSHEFVKLLKALIKPCFLTSLTTFAGFLSLFLSSIPPIKEFSIIASLGIIFEFFFAFTFLPGFILIFGPKKFCFQKKNSATLNTILKKTSELSVNNYLKIFIIFFILMLLALTTLPFIKTDTNLINYFKKDSPIYLDTKFIEKNLSGVNTIDISLKSRNSDYFKTPEGLNIIEKITIYSNSLNKVNKTVSINDFIKDMYMSFNGENRDYYKIPENREIISQLLFIYEFEELEDFITDDFNHARISVRISENSSAKQKQIINNIKKFINGLNTKNIEIKITGRVVKDIQIVEELVKGQVKSIVSALVVISIILLIVMKSHIYAFISIIPNLFPIALNFGIMKVFNIPLNEGTALISAVAIGIAVDDTIHFMDEYIKTNKESDTKSALIITIQNKGKAIILSSLILSIGFCSLILSSFLPSVHFGILSCLIMISAVLGDIFFLTGTILFFKRFGLIPST